MKKIITVILTLFILTGCKPNPKKFYHLNIGDTTIIVGAESPDTISDFDYINSFTTYSDKDENEYLESVEIYLDDLPEGTAVSIGEDTLVTSIEENCTNLKGEFVENNGHACVLHKTVGKKTNYIILTGDLLADDLDALDRIQVYYK